MFPGGKWANAETVGDVAAGGTVRDHPQDLPLTPCQRDRRCYRSRRLRGFVRAAMLLHRKANLLRHIEIALSDGVDCSDEFGWIAALGQIAVRACGKSRPNGTWLNIGGEDKDSQVRPFGFQVRYELKSTHTRHAEIEYEKIGGALVQHPVNSFAIRGFSTDRKLVHGRQKLFQTFPNDGVIVSNDRFHQPAHASPLSTTVLG